MPRRRFSGTTPEENVVVGIWVSEEATKKAQPAIDRNWQAVGDYVDGQPQITEFKNGMTLRGE